jgi:hypothetical protein
MSAWYNKTMAFPNELNINYYKGDTQEFAIYPKKTDGSEFSMTGYTPRFTIAAERGSSSVISAYAAVDSLNSAKLLCVIRPADGAQLTPGTTYYYDVEISKSGVPYPFVYTILTGTISVTEQVTRG